ncbi:hypothetical protein GGC65_004215 [Sphingopyxis sp. OAS728]|nr:hypothetical protein [Sphingopyxis sp. OAS728]MBE1529759.1 hypothetical protein [Sphingopyxis sp. OAS728]
MPVSRLADCGYGLADELFHALHTYAFDSSYFRIAEIFDAVHKEYIPCGGIEVCESLLGASQEVARFEHVMRIGTSDIFLLETVMRRMLAPHAGTRAFPQKRARSLREIGARLVADMEIALRAEEASKTLLNEIGDILRMRVAAKEAREARALLGKDRLGPRGATESFPVPGRYRFPIAQRGAAVVVIVIIHRSAFQPGRRRQVAGC